MPLSLIHNCLNNCSFIFCAGSKRSLYMRIPHPLTVLAARNGHYEEPIRLTAADIPNVCIKLISKRLF